MLLALAFMLPPFSVLACLGLNRFIPTRWCAFVAALGLALATLCLIGVRSTGRSMILIDLPWFELTERTLRLSLSLDLIRWPIALVVLAGGSLIMAGLGLALPIGLRGFGGLPAMLALMITATLTSVANTNPALQPVTWMLVVFTSAIVLRASGTLLDSDAPLIVALAGTIATMLLLAVGLLIAPGAPYATISLVCLIIACLLMLGCAPFTAVASATSEAPAGIGGALLALGLPLAGGQTLMTIVAEVGFPVQWRIVLILLGLLSVLACGAGALRVYQARTLLAWQHGAQLGVFLIAVGVGGPALELLLCATCSTLAAALALALLERRTGTDDLRTARLSGPLPIPGLALLIAGATAVGLPGTVGFWMRGQLFAGLTEQGLSWAIGVLLIGAMLLGMSYLAPLAIFWRTQPGNQPETPVFRMALMLPGLAALPLIVLGIVPQLIGVGVPPPSSIAMLGAAAALLALIGLPLWLQRFSQPTSELTDQHPGSAALPNALAESLGGLAWVATPTAALNIIWEALLRVSLVLTRLLARVEERYYLAGLMLALIIVVLVFI